VAQWITWAHAAGLAVILDLHWSAPPGLYGTDQQAMADSQSVTFWSQVAAQFAADPSIVFELFNEPYNWPTPGLTWSCWRNGGCALSTRNQSQNPQPGDPTFVVAGMQTLLDAVRTAGAKQPVIVNGLNYANDLTGWLTNQPTDALGQVIAGWHNYLGQGCNTTCWNTTVTAVAASVPVLITEFGYEPSNPGYFASVMNWADAHGIGYLPWAWWWDAGTSPYQLLADGAFTPSAGEGATYRAHLAGLNPTPAPAPTPTPTPPAAPSPGSVDRAVITALYEDFLGRAPEPSGMTFWQTAINNGLSQSVLVQSIVTSREYAQLRVRQAYVNVLHRDAEPNGLAWWVDNVMRGAVTVDDVEFQFYLSNEFYNQGGGTDAGYVRHMYQVMLGRSAAQSEVDFWVNVIRTQGRDAATAGVWYSMEAAGNRVAQYYQTLLKRALEPSGRQFWASVMLNSGEGAVRVGIAGSTEYRTLATKQYPNA
jgi:hypothetical protein